jgi:hypothetical protein
MIARGDAAMRAPRLGANSNDETKGEAMERNKYIIVWVVVAILLIFLAYGIARYQARGELAAERAACSQQLQNVGQRMGAAEATNRLLQARIALYRSLVDLDQRNFGLANTRVREAAAALAALDPAALGIDTARLDTVRQEVAATNIDVALNLEEQRNRLLGIAAQLDQLLPTPAGAAPLPAPAAPLPPAAPPAPATPAQR